MTRPTRLARPQRPDASRHARTELPLELLDELFEYDSQSGIVAWRRRDASWFRTDASRRSFNTRCAGTRAGKTLDPYGFRVAALTLPPDDPAEPALRVKLTMARIAFALHHRRHALGDVVHINSDRSDDRISNLRDVPHADALYLSARRTDNRSGVTGVHLRRDGRFEASIKLPGHPRRYLGVYLKLSDAIAARQAAERFRQKNFTSNPQATPEY